jgi:hypothetical protein
MQKMTTAEMNEVTRQECHVWSAQPSQMIGYRFLSPAAEDTILQVACASRSTA